MSFGFVPTPIFIALILGCAVALMHYAVKTFLQGQEKLWAVGWAILCLTGLSAAIGRGIDEYFEQYRYLTNTFGIVPLILGLVGFAFIVAGGWPRIKDDPIRKKKVVICLIVMVVGIAIIVIEAMRI